MSTLLGILAFLGCLDLIIFIVHARGRASDFTSWMCWLFGKIEVPMFIGFILKLVDVGLIILFINSLFK